MSAYSWGVEISRMLQNNLGSSHSIYSFGYHNLRDNTNYWFFILNLKEHYTTVMGFYLSLSSGDLNNTSSHICGTWYLPIFLFRDESLTLINIASLMALAILWSSLPTMLKLSRDSSWPVVLWWSWMGVKALMCSLNLSANVLPLHSPPCCIWIYMSQYVPGGCSFPLNKGRMRASTLASLFWVKLSTQHFYQHSHQKRAWHYIIRLSCDDVTCHMMVFWWHGGFWMMTFTSVLKGV